MPPSFYRIGAVASHQTVLLRRGFFLGCSKYPKCKGTRELPAELQEKLEATGAGAA